MDKKIGGCSPLLKTESSVAFFRFHTYLNYIRIYKQSIGVFSWIMEAFPTQAACIFGAAAVASPECPQCASTHVKRRNENDTLGVGIDDCRTPLTQGTLFHGTKISQMVSAIGLITSSTLTRFRGAPKIRMAGILRRWEKTCFYKEL